MRGMKELDPADLLALALVPGAGHRAVARAIHLARNLGVPLSELAGRPLRDLLDLCPAGSQPIAEHLAACTPRVHARACRLLDKAEASGIRPVLPGSREYPLALRIALGSAAPNLLFIHGVGSLLARPAAGIVGTRAPSTAGVRWAKACAGRFAEAGIPVVSGGAQGVDTAAHRAALRRRGETIVVLPQGLLSCTIPRLYRAAAAEGRAVLLSEFPPKAPWQAHAAITRNATISALARLVCVIEPRKTGGSMCTARHALGQGKPVFFAGLGRGAHLLRSYPGAASLLGGDGYLCTETLMEAWARPAAAVPRQSRLC